MKKFLMVVFAVIFVALFIVGCSVGSSKEDMLTSEKWYRTYTVDHSSYEETICQTMRFYSNGTVVYSACVRYGDDPWLDGDVNTREYDWELLEDDILVYEDDYYEWGDDWKVTGNKLIIDGNEYTHDNPGIDD